MQAVNPPKGDGYTVAQAATILGMSGNSVSMLARDGVLSGTESSAQGEPSWTLDPVSVMDFAQSLTHGGDALPSGYILRTRASSKYGVTPAQISKWVSDGEIVSVKVGKQCPVRESDLIRLVSEQGTCKREKSMRARKREAAATELPPPKNPEGYTTTEIARILGCTTSTLQRDLTRKPLLGFDVNRKFAKCPEHILEGYLGMRPLLDRPVEYMSSRAFNLIVDVIRADEDMRRGAVNRMASGCTINELAQALSRRAKDEPSVRATLIDKCCIWHKWFEIAKPEDDAR